jgi:hypothetical protein
MCSISSLKTWLPRNRIIKLGKKVPNAKKLLDYLFTQPIVTTQNVAELLDISQVSAYKIIEDFVQVEILKETTGFKRNLFSFEEYINVFAKSLIGAYIFSVLPEGKC